MRPQLLNCSNALLGKLSHMGAKVIQEMCYQCPITGAGTAFGIELCSQPWDQHPSRSLGERASLDLSVQTGAGSPASVPHALWETWLVADPTYLLPWDCTGSPCDGQGGMQEPVSRYLLPSEMPLGTSGTCPGLKETVQDLPEQHLLAEVAIHLACTTHVHWDIGQTSPGPLSFAEAEGQACF